MTPTNATASAPANARGARAESTRDGAVPAPRGGGRARRPAAWVALLAGFAAFSVLVLAGVVPRGPIGSWKTPLWADIVLAPFSGLAMLAAALLCAGWALSGRMPERWARPAGRVIAALVAATALEVVLKAAFPGSAGQLGAVAFGPLDVGFYPSGHTLRSTIAALVAISLLSGLGAWRWVLLAFPVVIGAMLVAAGGHFPVDVAGGFLLGAGGAGWALSPWLGRSSSPWRAG